MKDISLKELLEAGCHFGHKVSRWHPKANEFIYQSREGIHIIDLAKTKDGLVKAAGYVKKMAQEGQNLLVVATKRQAKGIVSDAAKRAGLPYLTNRWVGGIMTNWEEVKKNIDKVLRMRDERTNGSWKKFPKHEQVALEKSLRKLEMVYAGITDMVKLPDALFVLDIKTEHIALSEAQRKNIPIVAVVDTNANPKTVDFAIPANDDAIGSITCLVNYIMDAYIEGREIREKEEGRLEGQKVAEEAIHKAKEAQKTAIVEKPASITSKLKGYSGSKNAETIPASGSSEVKKEEKKEEKIEVEKPEKKEKVSKTGEGPASAKGSTSTKVSVDKTDEGKSKQGRPKKNK